MEHLKIKLDNALSFVDSKFHKKYNGKSISCLHSLFDRTGEGNDLLGWVNLPSEITEDYLKDIEEAANNMRKKLDAVVLIGIGGSYLGAKSIISALSSSFSDLYTEGLKILYAGHNLSEDYLNDLLDYLREKSFGLVVVSKSGTTTEPAVSFRLLKALLEEKEGKEEASRRIVAITDKSKGALLTLAKQEDYKTYEIPDNIGGRYSVLTPVGLFPIALAGFDIRKIIEGAKYMQEYISKAKFEDNIATQYASIRNLLYENNFGIELFASFEPRLHFVAEWWKQLYGESEGKGHKGIFPACVDFTTDLHSMGQYIQDGERKLFETLISVDSQHHNVEIPNDKNDLDNLNYISGKRIGYVNKMAEMGTCRAHISGGVPIINIIMPKLNEYYLGELIYFYEIACGISGYILGVNPFDQPGVEEYKNNMFHLLGKKGY